MKRVGIILSLGCVLLLGGCTSKRQYEDTFKEYASLYYETYQKGISMANTDEYYAEVTKEMLASVDKYDMSKLDKCSNDSSVTMKVNLSTEEIENYEFNLKCD